MEEDAIKQYSPENWITAILDINRAVRQFRKSLIDQDISPQAQYFNEWNDFFAAVSDDHADNYEITFDKVTKYLFGSPNTLEEFINDVLRLVPPIKTMTEVKRIAGANKRGHVQIKYIYIDEEKLQRQIGVHNTFANTTTAENEPNVPPAPSDISSGIDSTIKEQVRELEEKLTDATNDLRESFNDLESNMSTSVAEAVKAAFVQVMQDTKAEATTMIQKIETKTKEGQLKADKLTGDIRKATDKIDALQNRSTSILNETETKTDRAIKAYLEAKAELTDTSNQVTSELKLEKSKIEDRIGQLHDTIDKHKEEMKTGVTEGATTTYTRKTFPDEYVIDGTTYMVRPKKFQEDKTVIACSSNDELLTTYTLIEHVAAQYGIPITPIEDLQAWDLNDAIPTTFPYEVTDFESSTKFKQAYNSMSLAIGTKLKTSVIFPTTFATAQLAINSYNNDGYEMLYHLIKNVHPELQRNKATKPSKPKFLGDINKYILQYTNWIQYQLRRQRPHHYDDDEIADDFLQELKQEPWNQLMKKGIDYVEAKLDRWKISSHDPFPPDLKLQFIGHTVMIPYLEVNENPLQGLAETPPAIRYFQQRGRSRSNSRSRQNMSRSNSRQRSTSSNRSQQYRECKICGGQHRASTEGCPYLHRHVHVEKFLKNSGRSRVQQQLEIVDNARRERSASRDSQRSRHSQQSQAQE